jgi:hypothetical protein
MEVHCDKIGDGRGWSVEVFWIGMILCCKLNGDQEYETKVPQKAKGEMRKEEGERVI